MRKLLVTGLYDQERRLIVDSIKSERKGDIRAIMLSEMFELLEKLLAGDLTVEQLRQIFAKPPLNKLEEHERLVKANKGLT